MSEGNGHKPEATTVEMLADRTRFRFREEELEIPEVEGVTLTLKSLSVREREMLPDPQALAEVDDRGERTTKAIRNAAEVFAVIVAHPKVSAEQAEEFLGDWPSEAFDRITEAYAELVGTREEEKAAAAEFPS